MQLRLRNRNPLIITQINPIAIMDDWKLGRCVKIEVMVPKLLCKIVPNCKKLQNGFGKDLSSAKKNKHGNRTYSSILPRGLVQDKITRTHIKERSNLITVRNRFKCLLCDRYFLNERYIRDLHFKRAHSNNRPFKCQYCSQVFALEISLIQHLEIHAEKPHVCRICKKRFPERHNLKAHLRTHKLLGDRYFCRMCSIFFPSSNKLSEHLDKHAKRARSFKCSVCSNVFLKSHHLNNHLRVHTGEKPHKCHFCKKSFSERNNLTRHMRGHTGEKPHVCKICKKEFAEARNLRRHLDASKGLHGCSVSSCNKQFCLGRDLVTHMRSAHSDSIILQGSTKLEKKFLIGYKLWRNRRAAAFKYL